MFVMSPLPVWAAVEGGWVLLQNGFRAGAHGALTMFRVYKQ